MFRGDKEWQYVDQGNCSQFNNNGFGIYNLSRLRDDVCYIDTRYRQSERPGLYNITNFYDCVCEAPNTKSVSLEQPAVLYRDGYGWTSNKGCNVDIDSELRNSRNLTNPRLIQQLYERPYLTVPYMGRGIGDTCQESYLRDGETTVQKKACNNLSGIHIEQQYYPLIPCVNDNIQNPVHIIPEDSDKAWVRGGQPSREVIRNTEYLQKCGYAYDGKYWKR
jgi:hypothetical protein